jgi:hypothetical protein
MLRQRNHVISKDRDRDFFLLSGLEDRPKLDGPTKRPFKILIYWSCMYVITVCTTVHFYIPLCTKDVGRRTAYRCSLFPVPCSPWFSLLMHKALFLRTLTRGESTTAIMNSYQQATAQICLRDSAPHSSVLSLLTASPANATFFSTIKNKTAAASQTESKTTTADATTSASLLHLVTCHCISILDS